MKKKEKAYILKKEVTIPAGTVLRCISGRTTYHARDNYATVIGLTKDSTGEFIYNWDDGDKDLPEWLEETYV